MRKFVLILLCIGVLFSSVTVFAEGYSVIDTTKTNVEVLGSKLEKVNSSDASDIQFEYIQNEQSKPENLPDIGSKAVYLIHPETGKVIYEKNSQEKMYPASTTKIMTALMALENCQMTDKVVISKKAISLVPYGYSVALLEEGEEFTVYTLLQALLIPSGNEAANALAEHISGDIDSFAELCNKRAKELGCTMLHFVNPNGVHNDNHYCCARDMYLIAKECKKYDAFNEIVSSKNFTVPSTKIHPANDRILENTNQLLLNNNTNYTYEYCTGIKTGHTEEAGECLISSASKDGVELMCVVLGGKVRSDGLNERFYDTKRLYEFAYKNFSYKTIAESGTTYADLTIENATDDTRNLELIINSDINAFVPVSIDKDNVKAEIVLLEKINAPIKAGDVLGTITFKADGLNYSTYLTAKTAVERQSNNVYYIAGIILLLLLLLLIRKNKRNKKKKKKA